MPAVTDICNRAIMLCGVGDEIASLDERSPEAEACTAAYDPSLHELYREYKWSHATKRVSLALLSSTTTAFSDEYFYAYQYPSDCELAKRITNDIVLDEAESFIPFKRMYSTTYSTEIIATNQDEAELEYIFFNDNEATFPWDFAEALAHRIAYKILPRLAEDPDKLKLGMFFLAQSKKIGRASAANEHKPAIPINSEFLDNR